MRNICYLTTLVALLALGACSNNANNNSNGNNSSSSGKSDNTWTSQTGSSNPEEFMKQMSSQFTQFMQKEFQNFIDKKNEKKAPVRKPEFKEKDVKKALEYDLMLKGEDETTYSLQIGHFEIDNARLEAYATMVENGLITLSTKSIKKDGGNNYSVWADVALTSAGKKYVSKNNAINEVKNLKKSKYDKVLHPVRDRNAYGELEEELEPSPEIGNLVNSFYAALPASVAKAVKAYGEEELVDTYDRVKKIDSYLKVLAVPVLLPQNSFIGGAPADNELAFQPASIYKVTKYIDTYRINFKAGNSVVLILTPDHTKIFDLVVDEEEGETIRTRNARWTDKDVKIYADMAAAPEEEITTEQDLGIERIWNAPGLVLVGEYDRNRYVYPVEKADAVDQFVKVVLYQTVIDRVYNVKILTEKADDDEGNDYLYTATADVVYKKVNISPFQYILQKSRLVTDLGDSNGFEKKHLTFESYDDHVWGLTDGKKKKPAQPQEQYMQQNPGYAPYGAGMNMNGNAY